MAGTGKKIYKLISPTKTSAKRKAAWDNAKGMLKERVVLHVETTASSNRPLRRSSISNCAKLSQTYLMWGCGLWNMQV